MLVIVTSLLHSLTTALISMTEITFDEKAVGINSWTMQANIRRQPSLPSCSSSVPKYEQDSEF